jgi:hypothetical protein
MKKIVIKSRRRIDSSDEMIAHSDGLKNPDKKKRWKWMGNGGSDLS